MEFGSLIADVEKIKGVRDGAPENAAASAAVGFALTASPRTSQQTVAR